MKNRQRWERVKDEGNEGIETRIEEECNEQKGRIVK